MTSAHPAIVDCWNRIGVNGDHSCAALAPLVHCRNCPVYADAAQRNLQRPVDAAYRAGWAAHFRQPAAHGGAFEQAALVFRLGREWLALPAASIDAVAPVVSGHRLPHRARAGLLGIVNVGGTLTPWMALDAVLGIDGDAGGVDPASAGRHVFARLLVLRHDGQRLAMRVAELHGIARYRQDELAPPPATVNKGLERLLLGVLPVENMRVGLLDVDLLGHQLNRLLR
ncbi:chemotaxis protein CheW [Massilia sp. DWR3-1-1]|uniref:chemotaxis protein CheW n=1 Tax=Massilia sp. DWR3-1-1 TaxID=2804559 RepID=UPI003CF173A0